MWRVGIDVGGTFTDLFAWDASARRFTTSKVLTTKHDRSEGVLNALAAAGIPASSIDHLIHGTTTATNALIERDYPAAALVTTDGFRDTIEIGRQIRQHLYDPYQTKPKPIIRRRYRHTVPERMGADGKTSRPLDVDAATRVAEKLAAQEIKSIAVGFINSYANPAHEEQMRDILRKSLPTAHIVLSAETRPVFREHGRFVTTAIRAVLMPVMESYFAKLQARLDAGGFQGRLLILKSSGGVATVETASQHPEQLIESGPAGGVAYSQLLAKTESLDHLIGTDVGGTSFDVSLVDDGRGVTTRDHELEWEVPVLVPMLDIHSVGAGGGSIGWLDEGGSLRVGPKSAGSEPGPVCYQRGGNEPTITDANLVLGRIEPTLGGKFELDKQAALDAIGRLGSKLGLSAIETAEAMIRIVCEYMAQAVKMVLTSRGRDPRDYSYISFGGAGALHASFVAKSLSVPKVIVPAHAGVASALGAVTVDLRHDLEGFYFSTVTESDPVALTQAYASLEAQGRTLLRNDGVPDHQMELKRTAQMRYVGQTYEVEADIPAGPLTAAGMDQAASAFHILHKREYGVSSTDFAPAFVSIGVTAIGKFETEIDLRTTRAGTLQACLKSERDVYLDGQWSKCPVYDGEALPVGVEVRGPTIIEFSHACAVVPASASAVTNRTGHLVIHLPS
jgi:N-methylhydantoinase A